MTCHNCGNKEQPLYIDVHRRYDEGVYPQGMPHDYAREQWCRSCVIADPEISASFRVMYAARLEAQREAKIQEALQRDRERKPTG